jgi:DNA polymerase III alpha subunit
VVPIEPASMHGRTVIQWDKDDLDQTGLIKIDLLGLGMLTMIQEGLKLVKKHRNYDIDLGGLDMKDQTIYEMLRKADTIGLFQVESRAQMSILPKIHPTCFYDIIVSIAIVRPGPIQGNIIHPYLRRRRGEEPVSYLHPSLEPILKRTLGVPLFQEQGMRLAVVAAGFTPSQADNLRRVMSHKRSQEKMDKLCEELGRGMKKNDFTESAIQQITHQLRAFANYGFPESHAASFSLLVYASAYLKCYFPAEFYCAILNAQPMGFYSPATLIRDAQRHNIEILPVDLARSDWDCTLETSIKSTSDLTPNSSATLTNEMPAKAIPGVSIKSAPQALEFSLKDEQDLFRKKLSVRMGIRYVQGLGAKARASLESAWGHGGKFVSLEDVLERSGLGENDLKLLARAGAFQSFFPERRQALWETLVHLKKKHPTPLLDLLKKSPEECVEEQIKAMTPVEEITTDFKMMNLSTRDHLMSFYRDWAKSHGILACTDLKSAEHGKRITVAGAVITRQRPETAKGFVFITMEDETGMANIIVKPPKFEEYKDKLLHHSFLAVTGKLQSENGVVNVLAEVVNLLPPLPGNPQLPARNFQ